jgi:hypothetical protein
LRWRSELDRQHGEEKLKQKIDVPLGVSMISAMMCAVCLKNLRFAAAFIVISVGVRCARDSTASMQLGLA